MGCESRDSQSFGVFLHNVPDYLLSDFRAPHGSFPTDTSKQFPVSDFSRIKPSVQSMFNPIRNWDCSYMPRFSYEVNNCPMILTALNVFRGQINQLTATQSTAKQHSQNGTIPLTFESVCIGELPQGTGFFHRQPIPEPHS